MWAAGGGFFQLDAGDYIATVQFITGEACQTDQICLVPYTPVSERTWGAVKRLYR